MKKRLLVSCAVILLVMLFVFVANFRFFIGLKGIENTQEYISDYGYVYSVIDPIINILVLVLCAFYFLYLKDNNRQLIQIRTIPMLIITVLGVIYLISDSIWFVHLIDNYYSDISFHELITTAPLYPFYQVTLLLKALTNGFIWTLPFVQMYLPEHFIEDKKATSNE